MTYAETLDYIFHKLPMYSRIGSAAYKEDLTNVRQLCGVLNDPQNNFPSIHVAGTNGKGSVSHMLASIFQTAGYNTGLYTSPHLYDFRERIRLNGAMIPEAFVTEFVEKMKAVIEEIEPSFFEITVAMAFQYFAQQRVDIAIVEVGLGGRLDSTNIIHPHLSIITNIGFDHMAILGDSLPKIAAEKAGIIKPNVPVVVGETKPETRPVFEQVAAEKKAPLRWAETFLRPVEHRLKDASLQVVFETKNGVKQTVSTDLAGVYQIQNLRTVLTAVDELRQLGWKLEEQLVSLALQQVKKNTGLGGRWEEIAQQPTIVLEVAHNEDGLRRMTEHLSQLSFGRLHLVIGFVKDKAIDKILTLLPAGAACYFTQANIPRALPATALRSQAEAVGLTGNAFENVNDALNAAKTKAAGNDLIIICGSIFLVAEVNRDQ